MMLLSGIPEYRLDGGLNRAIAGCEDVAFCFWNFDLLPVSGKKTLPLTLPAVAVPLAGSRWPPGVFTTVSGAFRHTGIEWKHL